MKTCVTSLSAIALAATLGWTTVTHADGHQGNSNIVRMVSGTHSFYEEDGTTVRGREFFRMVAHPDGERTMTVTKDTFSTDRQHTIVMRVDENFRPVEVFASYRYPDGFKGSVRVAVDGDLLSAASFSPFGLTNHEIRVPDELAIISHGEVLNGWAASVMDASDTDQGGPVELQRTSYSLSAPRDGDGPVLGGLTRPSLTRVGEETVTTPAGTFETIHYRTGPLSIWAMKGDRIMVKQAFRGETYILTEFQEE